MKKLVLIDGHHILYRSYFGYDDKVNTKGDHIQAVIGLISTIANEIKRENADYVAVTFDNRKADLERTKTYEDYKGNRAETPDDFKSQIPIAMDMLKTMGIPYYTSVEYEADDILGTISQKAQDDGYEVVILSGDKDLLQLADEHVKVTLYRKINGKTGLVNFYPKDVYREFGVTPKEFIQVKALMGDKSDNIPGATGIGEKTANKLISEYKSIDKIYENIDDLPKKKIKKIFNEQKDQIYMSLDLVTIRKDIPINFVGYGDCKKIWNDEARKSNRIWIKTYP
jgi:DNA polymerase-1